ncbi:MAG: hypothetical protein PQJ59_16435 [Spirochaetales bacterium]|nr:hypothetical protein [Spirochaetales bacterium]
MKGDVFSGLTEFSDIIFIRDTSVTTSVTGLTGLTYDSTGLVGYYVRPGESATAITLATQTVTGAYSSGGFVEIDATNMPGFYRIDWPVAIFATGVRSAFAVLSGATNMEAVRCQWDITSFEKSDETSDDRLVNIDEASAPSEIREEMDSNSTQLAAIVEDTGTTLPTTLSEIDAVVDTIQTTTDKLDDTLVLNGEGTEYQFTEDALENGPSGGTGEADWTDAEKQQMRDALGVDGDKTTATGGQLQTLDTVADGIKAVTDLIPDAGAMTSIAQEATIEALNDISPSEVNSEMLDVLNVDTFGEPGSGQPAITISLVDKIGWLYKYFRNKKVSTSTGLDLYEGTGSTVDNSRTHTGSDTEVTVDTWDE